MSDGAKKGKGGTCAWCGKKIKKHQPVLELRTGRFVHVPCWSKRMGAFGDYYAG